MRRKNIRSFFSQGFGTDFFPKKIFPSAQTKKFSSFNPRVIFPQFWVLCPIGSRGFMMPEQNAHAREYFFITPNRGIMRECFTQIIRPIFMPKKPVFLGKLDDASKPRVLTPMLRIHRRAIPNPGFDKAFCGFPRKLRGQ